MKTAHALAAVALASLATLTFARQEPEAPAAWDGMRWEYKVVGLTDIYGSTLDYLKGAMDRNKGGLWGLAEAADDQLVSKTQDLLNEHGVEGWELEYYSNNVVIFKRPAR